MHPQRRVHAASSHLAAALLCAASVAASRTLKFDVVVYGATPAGIAAAIVAANGTGLAVALLEPSGRVGGMSGPGGIGLRDIGDEAMSGVADGRTVLNHWLHRNRLAYNVSSPVWQPDARVGEANWRALVADVRYNITLALETALLEAPGAVARDGATITALTTVWTATEDPDNTTTWRAAALTRRTRATSSSPPAQRSPLAASRAPNSMRALRGCATLALFSQFAFAVDPLWPNGSALPGVDL